MKKHWDIRLIAGILIIAAGIWLFLRLTREEGAYAVVSVNGVEQARYPLSESFQTEIVTESGSNLLVIENGKARVTEADCPDKLCVHQKAVSCQGESIICLPHKLTVTVEGGPEGSVDAVAK